MPSGQLITSGEYEDNYDSLPRIAAAIIGDAPTEAIKAFAKILQDDRFTDIQIVDWNTVYAKVSENPSADRPRSGTKSSYQSLSINGVPFSPFRSEAELILVLNHLLAESTNPWKTIPDDPHKIVSPKTAMIETRIPGGHRIHITMPPISDSVNCTIAKFKEKRMTMQDIVRSQSLTPTMASFLEWAVDARLSILVTGETGAGKTTLLQAMAGRFGAHMLNEMILVIEDTPELRLSVTSGGVTYWRVVHNDDGTLNGEVSLSDLVKASLRRRMQRLVISEVRGEEAWFMVDANNTGVTGTLCTLHGNSPLEAVARLQNLCLRASIPGLVLDSVKRDIASAFQLVCHLKRDSEGRYVVSEISEISSQDDADHRVAIHVTELFKYEFGRDGIAKARHVMAPSDRLKQLAMERSQLACPDIFDNYDPKSWELAGG